ncbi:MAG: STAS domain-containing protein [Rhodocyclaceae bacterium]
MEIVLDTALTPARLTLTGEMTIYAAAELHGRLLAALDDCSALQIDLSAIEEVDSAGLQLLIVGRQHALATGKPLGLAALSRPVRELLELYGLAGFFGDSALAGFLGDPPLAAPDADQPSTGEPA